MKPYSNISRTECVNVILMNALLGVTTIVRGHNGWGKTAMEYELRKARPDHKFIKLDMSVLEAGDILMPKFQEVNGKDVVAGVPHKQFGFHEEGPVIVFLDEIFKAKKALQVQIADLLHKHELGGHKLHPDSIVCGASNLEDENFGDQSLGFVYNRISVVEMRKPTGEEWIDDYALPRGLHPTIIQSAREYPMMFNDYRMYSKPGENQYIFDPRAALPFYVTGRSLERASNILTALKDMSAEVKTHALIHCVGERAAMDIMAVNELHAELPAWEDIVKSPEKTKVPTSAGACCLLIYTAIQRVEKKTVAPWMKYLERFKKEAQALFASSILKVESKNQIVAAEKCFLDWAMKNSYMYKAAV